jgi:S1-C subfamily serine protease
MEDSNRQPLSLGSGFFVGDGEIASNFHVIKGAATGYAKLIGDEKKYDIEGITAIDLQRDLVVLKTSSAGSQVLPFGNSDAVEVGETVYVVGNPEGLEGTFSQGIISSIRDIGTDKILQITAPISPGSSGGPVLNARGEVIGVSFATIKVGQNLNFAIPSRYLKTLVAISESSALAPQVKPLSQINIEKPQKSIVADLGGRIAEGIIGRSFLWGERIYGFINNIRHDDLGARLKQLKKLALIYSTPGLCPAGT